ncbi:MAG: NAD-dependent protein deacylase [Rhodospirillaceae bacterium]|nr:NAD-dependent protein deacylase [Rhodospirillaceae bacterium]
MTETAPTIVILTGAGISKESGLDTFRDSDGIWAEVRIEDVATPEAYTRNPTRVQEFYNARRAGLKDPKVVPNAAHYALALLEKEWPGEVLLVTQNIDDLHERAGSTNLIHMHGELMKARCAYCDALMVWDDDLFTTTPCPHCGRKSGLRPHVVWFGEMPLGMDKIYESLDTCHLFVSIGTSGNVYPAAGFVQHVRYRGLAHSVELNLEPSQGATLFSEAIYGPATEIVPAFINRILKDGLPRSG